MESNFSRRDFLAGATAAGASVVLLPAMRALAGASVEPATEMATGMVFEEDGNKGVQSPARRGIAGVLVSNGRDIVRTDAGGRYRIPVRDGDVLFVIKPSQWMTPLTEFNLPKFYYFHRPTGSPQWRPTNLPNAELLDPTWLYKGVGPTGELPASIDFPLRRSAEPDEFKVVVFGDTQVTYDAQIDYMSRGTISELVNAPGIAFGLSVGDLVNIGLLYLFQPLNEVQAKTGFPWYAIPGNHDQNLVTPNDELAEEQYRTVYGPTVYSFEYGPVSFLMLGNVRRQPLETLSVDAKTKMAQPDPSPYTCGLRDEQWQFVESYLKTVPTDRQLVITMHMDMSLHGHDRRDFTKRLLSLISGRPHTLSISGHTHIQRHLFFGEEAGFSGPDKHHHFNTICVRGAGYRGMFNELKIPSCQAEDGTPAGYSYLSFTKTGYSIRYKASRHPADHQMNIFVPPVLKLADVKETTVLANIFAGSERSAVRMRVNDGEWKSMTLTPQRDPSIFWVLDAEKQPQSWLGSKYNLKDTPPDAFHIWQVDLPQNLKPGAHVLQIETVDMHGQKDSKMTLFRVLPA